MCIMVTPSFSADCADVQHACHEGYARTAVIAYWRHMSTERRGAVIRAAMQEGVRAVSPSCIGATVFEDPSVRAAASHLDYFLGTRELYTQFEGREDSKGRREGWTLALMEMLVDPLLSLWVPAWVHEQFERANPYFADVLREFAARRFRSNAALLRALRREMVRRHRRSRRKQEAGKAGAAGGEASGSGASVDEETGDDGDEEAKAQEAAVLERLASEENILGHYPCCPSLELYGTSTRRKL